jgi:hypothetical protein
MALTPEQEAAYTLDNRLDPTGLSSEARAEYDRLLHERYAAASRGQHAAPEAASPAQPAQAAHPPATPRSPLGQHPGESLDQAYLRQIHTTLDSMRTSINVIMVIVVLAAIGSVIAGIITAAELHSLVNNLNNGAGGSGGCASLGGTNPNC